MMVSTIPSIIHKNTLQPPKRANQLYFLLMSDRFATLRAPHPVLLFVVMFVACLAIQLTTWNRSFPFDAHNWVDAGRMLNQGQLIPTNHFVYGYPGTTVIGLTAGFIRLGADGELALRLSIGFWYSLFSAVSVLLAYLLRPKTAWWALAGWAFLLQSLVYFATPPSSVLGPMLTAFALLVLWVLEHKKQSFALLALIGIAGGICAVTRVDIGGLVVGTGILALSIATRSFRVFLLTSLTALLTFFALNPFMWNGGAIEHITATLEKIGKHAEMQEGGNPDGVIKMVLSASFVGILALFFTLTAPLHRLPLSLKKSFLIWTSGVTVLLLGALTISAHHPVWIFYPALLLWEILLPILVISAVPRLANIVKMNPAVLGAFLIGVHLTYYIVRYYLMTH